MKAKECFDLGSTEKIRNKNFGFFSQNLAEINKMKYEIFRKNVYEFVE